MHLLVFAVHVGSLPVCFLMCRRSLSEHLLRHGPDGVCGKSLVWRHELHSSSSSSSSPAFCSDAPAKRRPGRGLDRCVSLTPEVPAGDKRRQEKAE